MARIRKYSSLKNLISYDVEINDIGPFSDYFRISQLPEIFSAGKNSFLIGASPYLKPRSSILVEIVDKDGNTVYTQPIQSTSEADARIIAVEIYESTISGPYKLIIMGQASVQKDGTPVKVVADNVYNVRWIKDIKVDANTKNISPIRFITSPQIVDLQEKRLLIPSSSFSSVTQSIDFKVNPRMESGILNGYTINPLDSTVFNRKHVLGIISGTLTYTNSVTGDTGTESVSLKLTDVINNRTVISDGNYIEFGGTKVEYADLYNSSSYATGVYTIVSSSFQLRYQDISILPQGIETGSFAQFKIVNMEPYSGEIYRTQVSYKPVGDAGTYKTISSPRVEVSELLVSGTSIGDVPIGNFYSESFAATTDNWYANILYASGVPEYPIAASVSYQSSSVSPSEHLSLQSGSAKLLDMVWPVVPVSGSMFSSSIAAYFFGTKKSFEVFESSEYTVKFDAYYTPTSGSTSLEYQSGSLDVYLTKQSDSKIISNDFLGQKIGSIVSNGNQQQNFRLQEFNFNPRTQVSGDVGLRFVAQNGFWQIGSVSVKPAVEFSFNPDEATFTIPVIDYANTPLIFRAEYLDVNSNSTLDISESVPEYFTGSLRVGSSGSGSGAAGSFINTYNTVIGDATIKSLPDTLNSGTGSVLLIPAPGAGYMHIVHKWIITVDATAGVYGNIAANNGYLAVDYEDAVATTTVALNNTDITPSRSDITTLLTTTYGKMTFIGQPPIEDIYSTSPYHTGPIFSSEYENSAITLTALNEFNGDFTGGNSANTMAITVFYSTINVSTGEATAFSIEAVSSGSGSAGIGPGTVNYISKFDPAGTNIVTSSIDDSGTTVRIASSSFEFRKGGQINKYIDFYSNAQNGSNFAIYGYNTAETTLYGEWYLGVAGANGSWFAAASQGDAFIQVGTPGKGLAIGTGDAADATLYIQSNGGLLINAVAWPVTLPVAGQVLTAVNANSTTWSSTFSGSFSGSFFGDGSQLTGVVPSLPSGIVSSSAQVVSLILGQTISPAIVSGSQFTGSFNGDGSQLTGVVAGYFNLFGNGTDGTVSLQQTSSGSALVTRAGTGSATEFVLTRDLYATSIDLDDSAGNFSLRTYGFRIFCTGVLTIDAGVTVHQNGYDSVDTYVAGGSVYQSGQATIGSSFSNGGTNGTTGAAPFGPNNSSYALAAKRSTTPVALGGAGGGYSAGTGNGTAGGTGTLGSNEGTPDNIMQAITMRRLDSQLFDNSPGGAGGPGNSGQGGAVVAVPGNW